MNGTAVAAQSAVVMARIVDAVGRNIERADIASVRYSLLEIAAGDVDEAIVVAGHTRCRLKSTP